MDQSRKMILNLTAAAVLAITFTGCGNEERKTFYEDGKIKAIIHVDSEKKLQDSFKRFSKSGELVQDLIYEDGNVVSGFVIKDLKVRYNNHSFIKKVKEIYEDGKVVKKDCINKDELDNFYLTEVKRYAGEFNSIEKPSEAVQLAAVETRCTNKLFLYNNIKNPTPKVIALAKRNGCTY